MARRRWIIPVSLAALLLLGAEVAVRQWVVAPKTCVQITNRGDAAMEDLVVSYAGSQVAVGRLPVGQSTHVWLSAGPKGLLRLDFKQKGNALTGFQIPDFDPAQIRRDGFKLVLVVKSNEIERFMDDDPLADRETLEDRVRRWIRNDPEPVK
jgi:hypothetical protein